jgi:hypothetical protein
MAKAKRRAFIKLDVRQKAHAELCINAERKKTGGSKGFRKPGSMNHHKQA